MYGLMVVTKLNDTLVPENNRTAADLYLKPLGQVRPGTQRFLDFRKARQHKSCVLSNALSGVWGQHSIIKCVSAIKCVSRQQSMIKTLHSSCQFRSRWGATHRPKTEQKKTK